MAGGVAGAEVEAQEAHLAHRVLLDLAQPAETRGLLGLGLDGVEVGVLIEERGDVRVLTSVPWLADLADAARYLDRALD